MRYLLIFSVFAVLLSACIPWGGTPTRPAATEPPEVVIETEPPASRPLAGWKIGIDPGHGWSNSTGATGNGMQEDVVTFQIAGRTKQILEADGATVIMTRDEEYTEFPITHAADVLNQEGVHFSVTIHTNASDKPAATGTESCYTVGKTTDSDSQRLAQFLVNHTADLLTLKNRGIYPENDLGRCGRGRPKLYIHDANNAAALIETAFISNAEDAAKLRDRQDDFARAIELAILEYVEGRNPNVLGIQSVDPVLPASTPEPVTNPTIEPVSFPTIQFDFYAISQLRYDPARWKAEEQGKGSAAAEGLVVYRLINLMVPGCQLQANMGRGTPQSWYRSDDTWASGGLTFRREIWRDGDTGSVPLVVYQHMVGDRYGLRYEVEIKGPAEDCLREVENVFLLSEDLILLTVR